MAFGQLEHPESGLGFEPAGHKLLGSNLAHCVSRRPAGWGIGEIGSGLMPRTLRRLLTATGSAGSSCAKSCIGHRL